MSGGYIFIDHRGGRSQWASSSVEEVVEQIVKAHQAGEAWDVRRRTTGQGHRVLTEGEAVAIVAAVSSRLVGKQ